MRVLKGILIPLVVLALGSSLYADIKKESYCLTGAFLKDRPSQKDIIEFKNKYTKKPFLIMVFTDWERFIDKEVINDVYSSDCVLFITWEPWYADKREPIDYDGLLEGRYDRYIGKFAEELKQVKGEVYLRFAHEMNGNWYPWSGMKIGGDKFIDVYRYIKDIFDRLQVRNIKWVFSINWEDIPQENNHFSRYYPGNDYVDFIGIDGYNWGNTQTWSRWMSFKDIFRNRYSEITRNFQKPVLISEFSSTSSGGNKAKWIKEAMNAIKGMQNVKAFVLFNVDKETDWNFSIDNSSGKELKKQLENTYFRDWDFNTE